MGTARAASGTGPMGCAGLNREVQRKIRRPSYGEGAGQPSVETRDPIEQCQRDSGFLGLISGIVAIDAEDVSKQFSRD